MEEQELTYLEHKQAVVKRTLTTIDDLLRNINLNSGDISTYYGCFSKQFYNRKDISNEKKELIKRENIILEEIIKDNEYLIDDLGFN